MAAITLAHRAGSSGDPLQFQRGTVVSASVVDLHAAEGRHPRLPRTLVMVELAEGCCVPGLALPGTDIGDQVQAGRLAHDRRCLPRFMPQPA